MARSTRRDDGPQPPEGNGDPRRTRLDPRADPRQTHVDPRPGAQPGSRDAPPPGGDHVLDPMFQWPEELARDWEFIRPLHEGGESQLYLVRGRHADNQGERVVKIYERRIRPPDDALIQRVAGFDSAHVVRMYDHFQLGSRWVEILEYVEEGSLEDLVLKLEFPRPPALVAAIVDQLHHALVHIHADDIVHRDIKPGNILVRRRDPLDLVLTDFGIASHLDGFSLRVTNAHRTEIYASPEARDGKIQTASDWWSVGMLLVEMLTGRHPFANAAGNGFILSREIEERLINDDVEKLVANVPEPFLLLCRGLLRRDIRNRWGSGQVRRWLEGDESLSVNAEAAPGRPAFDFAGTQQRHYALSDVARALSEHWSEGVASYGRGELQTWLRQVCEGVILADVQRIDGEWSAGDYGLNQALYRTIIAIDPTIVPSYRGYRLDESGLSALARQALVRDERAMEVLREVFESGCLSTYASMRGSDWHGRAEQLWHQQVQAYVRIAPLVPEDMRRELEGNLPLAVAAGLRASLSSEAPWQQDLRQRAILQRLTGGHVPAWYAQLEANIPHMAMAALIGVGALRPQAAEAAAAEVQRRREARAVFLGTALNASKILAILAVVLLAVVGIGSLLRLF